MIFDDVEDQQKLAYASHTNYQFEKEYHPGMIGMTNEVMGGGFPWGMEVYFDENVPEDKMYIVNGNRIVFGSGLEALIVNDAPKVDLGSVDFDYVPPKRPWWVRAWARIGDAAWFVKISAWRVQAWYVNGRGGV